jgi:hypothetical protein
MPKPFETPPPPPPLWVTPKEACRLASVGLTVLYDWLNNGTVISRKIGNKRLILLKSLECLGENDDGAEGFSPPSLTGRQPGSGRRRSENPEPVAAPSHRIRRGRSTAVAR